MTLEPGKHCFPCKFPIKVMGKRSLEFEAKVLSIVREHAPDLGEAAVDVRPSKKENYIALTITINAISQEQVDNIYRALSAEKLVLMVL